IIAHRLSTVRECNRIVMLREGEIMEVGSHNELMQQKGLYFQLASTGLNEGGPGQRITNGLPLT
ncbi:MAG: hypothetical protein ACXVBQ_17230, partial [Pseudobdellovibrionaceae bacterium]